MMRYLLPVVFILAAAIVVLSGENNDKGLAMQKYKQLTPEEERIIVHKGTEYPGTGEYLHTTAAGTYVCKRCDAPLYRSSDKFDSGCGWPAFDDEIPGAVNRTPDADGMRTEITRAQCGAHLSHVFSGERLTPKNVRHCVNSLSMTFIPSEPAPTYQKAYFAAGCFWGVEYWFKKTPGVIATRVGYMGGFVENPSYRDVCSGDTGYAEALEVTFDPSVITYEQLCRLFFEIHDFTQIDGQGPDIGEQYRSEIFYVDREQEDTAKKLLTALKDKGYKPATKLSPSSPFWEAEEYHQDYYTKTRKTPYCHTKRDVF